MKLAVLGCLGTYPYEGRGTSSYLLESEGFHLPIDAGSTTSVRLENYLDSLELDIAILSHYHHDHIADLGVLQYYRQLYPALEPAPILPIYGHIQDQTHFKKPTSPNVPEGKKYFGTRELAVGSFLTTFVGTIHLVTYYAMRIAEKATGKVFVLIGDSGHLASFEDFVKDAGLFLADTYLSEGSERHHAHSTPKEAGEIVEAAQVKRLTLAHLPQHGLLGQLREGAQGYVGMEIPTTLAQPDLTVEI